MDFDEELIDHVIAETKVFYDKYNVELNFHLIPPIGIPKEHVDDLVGPIQESAQGLIEQVHEMMRNVVADRVMLEVRLYLSQG